MHVEICPVGGFGEIGKNMCAVRVDDEVVIFDMGLHMPNYVKYTEEEREEVIKINPSELKRVNAIPDDMVIDDWRKMVKAIIPSHAHLDHVGAIPYLAGVFDAPVVCTPFTARVITAILRDDKIRLPNKIVELEPNAKIQLTKNLAVEFIHVTHSTPQTVFIALHTPYGVVLYATDFKIDLNPVLGKKFDMQRVEKLKGNVLVAIIDSLYSQDNKKTPCESVVREMLRDVLLGVESKNNAVIVTTFSSHIARIKTIIECASQLNRKVVLLGRSMAKYALAAEDAGIYDVSKFAEIVAYGSKVRKKMKEIEKTGRNKWLLVVTGHQGEPNSMLTKIADKKVPFLLKKEDLVVFSCNIIPVPVNIEHRKILEEKLSDTGVRMFKDIHVSGHASREDMRELIKAIQPKNLIPVHSAKAGIDGFVSLCTELGYEKGKTVHALVNGQRLIIAARA
ncbi:MAG: RNase J family beta-CASP ribonuclease [Candidatus Aenigmarchaeota archaeon]|nr:RNase J family beta-CASP ribonuclease [Candidatus Aenigmarchaeota archaeon]